MLTPFFFGNFFDEMFDSSFGSHSLSSAGGMLRADIRESDDGYELIVDVPGVKRENITAELKDGYLIINATIGHNSGDSSSSSGKYLRRERTVGSYRRSFYVGENISQKDITGKFEDGVLRLFVPKSAAQPKIEERKLISIEE